MAATDFTALVARIREVLCEGAVCVKRTIPPSTFRWTPGREALRDMPPSAGDLPTIDVEILSLRNSEGTPGNESGDWFLYECDVVVSVLYGFEGGDYLPFPDGSERASVTTRAANDAHRIRACLGYPGNLDRAESANRDETGLCSGLLEYQRSESDWTDDTHIARHTFLARVEIEPASEVV